MRKLRITVAAATFITSMNFSTIAKAGWFSENPEQAPPSEWMLEGKPVRAPKGYRKMCDAEPELCKEPLIASSAAASATKDSFFDRVSKDSEAAAMSKEKWNELVQVNESLNDRIWPRSDKELYGKSDHWTMPRENMGDCEDYAIAKRWELIRRGWPANSLLYGVAVGKKSPYHAMLIIRTEWGDYVLDNVSDKVMPWRESGYKWVIRQSHRNSNKWVRIIPGSKKPSSAPGKRMASLMLQGQTIAR